MPVITFLTMADTNTGDSVYEKLPDLQAYETQITVQCRDTQFAASKEIEGVYTVISTNHNKPVYKRNTQTASKKKRIILFFWDDRDGNLFNGWWFGRKVGDFSSKHLQVYNLDNSTIQPPTSGWLVGNKSKVRNSCIIIKSGIHHGGSHSSSG